MNDPTSRLPPAPGPHDEATLPPGPRPREDATLPPSSPDAAATLAPDGARPTDGGDARAPAGYAIEKELGRGGMGVVYLARSLALQRPCALKMILSGAHSGAAEIDRFKTEAQAIARLQHPGIVQVFEVGEHDGRPFMALEYCGGGSLDGRLAKGPLKPREAAALVRSLAEAVQAAHEAQVIHRDLKPANVLLTQRGEPKVTDFGLAKKLDEGGATRTGSVMGTPSYMPPEQAEGSKDVGPAADVYALGAILYECLTGRAPFKAATSFDTILQVLSDPPIAPSRLQRKVPRDLETICLKCLEKPAPRRFRSAADLAADLGRFLDGEPIQARLPGPLTLAWYWLRRPERVRDAGLAQILVWMVLTVSCLQWVALAIPVWQVLGSQEVILLGIAATLPTLGIWIGGRTVGHRLWALVLGACQCLGLVAAFTVSLFGHVRTTQGGADLFDLFGKNVVILLLGLFLNVSLILLALHGVALYAFWVNRDTRRTG